MRAVDFEVETARGRRDETAWLDAMADRIDQRDVESLDLREIGAYLRDMANRDRREMFGRLRTLIAHLIRWERQPGLRGPAWRSAILLERQEISRLAISDSLRAHAREVLDDVYEEAVELASAETGLPRDRFSAENPFDLESLLIVAHGRSPLD